MLAKFVKRMGARDRKRGAGFVVGEAAGAKQRVKKSKKVPTKSPHAEGGAPPKAKAVKAAGKGSKPAIKKVHCVKHC